MTANIDNMRETSKDCRFRDTKEIVYGYKAVVREDSRDVDLVDIRCYMSRSSTASVVYCALWISNKNRYGRGVGRAGGYGYHRRSAAITDAISDAGITLDKSISGVGESAEREAIEAICTALGYERSQYCLVEFFA